MQRMSMSSLLDRMSALLHTNRAVLGAVACTVALVGCRAPCPRPAPSGAELFATYCAICHGDQGRGDGSISAFLKVPAPDLTLMAARRHGPFPQAEAFRTIDGQVDAEFRRQRHMPIWGYEFFDSEQEDHAAHDAAVDRVMRLVAYLETLQRPGE